LVVRDLHSEPLGDLREGRRALGFVDGRIKPMKRADMVRESVKSCVTERPADFGSFAPNGSFSKTVQVE
jgi:hypothetical protein